MKNKKIKKINNKRDQPSSFSSPSPKGALASIAHEQNLHHTTTAVLVSPSTTAVVVFPFLSFSLSFRPISSLSFSLPASTSTGVLLSRRPQTAATRVLSLPLRCFRPFSSLIGASSFPLRLATSLLF
ncbi:hypothetical protein PIB30_119164 [Stylosanthes scabra]|uniref:Transmembrane protein n=1 Tax=Stylosanthes scabra TaxID=79078 RepID=A0ABU6XNC1_9FABA|nr:hypothetical protein [Stylosanthes scabra]